MSKEEELDSGESELQVLRRELLKGLMKKKSISIVTTSNSEIDHEENKDTINQIDTKKEQNDDDDDQDLESLRLNALKAKRKRTEQKFCDNNKEINQRQIKDLPGRFRYDKENSEEEDDDFELDLNQNNSFNENQDNDFTETHYNIDCDLNYKKFNSINQYHNKYQTYKLECSRRFAKNDAYEPVESTIGVYNSDCGSTETNSGYDLRDFLRSKTISKNNESTNNIDASNHLNTDSAILNDSNKLLDDLNYSKPITQPINLTHAELFNNKSYRYAKNNFGYYTNRANDYEKFSSQSVDKNKKLNDGSLSDNRDDLDDIEEEEDNDEDEDDVSNYKKLKSVVTKPVASSSSTKQTDSSYASSNYSSYSRRSRR